MTFLQPNKNSNFWNIALGFLGGALVLSVVGMVAFYNISVNLNHNIAQMKSELDAIGSKSTSMNNQIIEILGKGPASPLIAQSGLVAEKTPQYFHLDEPNQTAAAINQKWLTASHF